MNKWIIKHINTWFQGFIQHRHCVNIVVNVSLFMFGPLSCAYRTLKLLVLKLIQIKAFSFIIKKTISLHIFLSNYTQSLRFLLVVLRVCQLLSYDLHNLSFSSPFVLNFFMVTFSVEHLI